MRETATEKKATPASTHSRPALPTNNRNPGGGRRRVNGRHPPPRRVTHRVRVETRSHLPRTKTNPAAEVTKVTRANARKSATGSTAKAANSSRVWAKVGWLRRYWPVLVPSSWDTCSRDTISHFHSHVVQNLRVVLTGKLTLIHSSEFVEMQSLHGASTARVRAQLYTTCRNQVPSWWFPSYL